MRHKIILISFPIVTGLVLLVASMLFAQEWSPPPPETRCPSPWGATDERGAANHMTPDTVLNAARLITEGKVYELGRVLEPTMPTFGLRRFMIHTARTSGPTGVNQLRGNEEVIHTELGQVGTQFDALPHIAIGDLFYNCIKMDEVATRTGFTKLGVEKVGAVFTRGVLLDIAGLKGVEMLEAGYEITAADLGEATRRQGVDFRAGDAVLVHTGWGKLWMQDNTKYNSGEPGIGIAAAELLAEQRPLLVGADTWAVEVRPHPNKDLAFPVHQILLVTHGIFLLENLDLEALARNQVHTFAFIVQPLKIRGGTGSTVAPMAVR
jgi:kynurenine formamidase